MSLQGNPISWGGGQGLYIVSLQGNPSANRGMIPQGNPSANRGGVRNKGFIL